MKQRSRSNGAAAGKRQTSRIDEDDSPRFELVSVHAFDKPVKPKKLRYLGPAPICFSCCGEMTRDWPKSEQTGRIIFECARCGTETEPEYEPQTG